MRFLQLSAVAFGLMTTACSYQVTFYDKKQCNDDSEAKTYLVYEGSDNNCINIGDKPDDSATCARYEDGGNAPRKDCGQAFHPQSVYVDNVNTKFFGAEACWKCTFYEDKNCRADSATPFRGSCTTTNIYSFKCGHNQRTDPEEDAKYECKAL